MRNKADTLRQIDILEFKADYDLEKGLDYI